MQIGGAKSGWLIGNLAPSPWPASSATRIWHLRFACTVRIFSRPETDPFSGDYAAVLEPYCVDPLNAADTPTPASVAQQRYAASQQGDPTAFLLWHATPGLTVDRDPGHISLLHSVSHYESRMGRPLCRWGDETFANRGDVSYGTAPLDQWDPAYLHLAPAVLVPSAAVIDAAISGDPDLKLLGPYGVGDAGVESIRCRKTVYVPAPYVGLFSGLELTPVEAWQHIRGAIVDAAAEEACRPIVDWLRAALVRSGPNALSVIRVTKASAPLSDALLLQHHHWLLLSHLPGLDPNINHATGTRIAETVGEVAVELRKTRLRISASAKGRSARVRRSTLVQT